MMKPEKEVHNHSNDARDNSDAPPILQKMYTGFFSLVKNNRLFVVVVILAFFLRLSLFISLSPVLLPDSDSYERSALALKQGNNLWTCYPRTPVYPGFVAFVYSIFGDNNHRAVAGIQILIFGMINTLLIYLLGKRLTSSNITASITAFLVNLDLFAIQFDLTILTESLSGFLLLLSTFLLIKSTDSTTYYLTALAGIITGLMCLVRPAFTPLLGLFFIFFVIVNLINRKQVISWKKIATHVLIFLILAVLPCFIWLKGNHARGKGFSFSPFMLNAGLTNHTGYFFERLPDKYASIRNPYIRNRNKRELVSGTYYRVKDKMFRAAQKNFDIKTERQFEKFITGLNLQLIRENPRAYLKTLGIAWRIMWRERTLIYMQPRNQKDEIRNFAALRKKIFWGFWFRYVEARFLLHPVVRILKFPVYLLGAVFLLIFTFRDKRAFYAAILIVFIVMGLSIMINALELSENSRYRAPYQHLIIMTIIAGYGLCFHWIYSFIMAKLAKTSSPGPPEKKKGTKKNQGKRISKRKTRSAKR
mgnify:CR=1 FL=1